MKERVQELYGLNGTALDEIAVWKKALEVSVRIARKYRSNIKILRYNILKNQYAILKNKQEIDELEKVYVELINHFDVLGNAKDGWEVNNQCREWDGVLEDWSRKSVMKLLKEKGFFPKHIRENQIEWEEGDDCWILNQRKDGMPLCMLNVIPKPEVKSEEGN